MSSSPHKNGSTGIAPAPLFAFLTACISILVLSNCAGDTPPVLEVEKTSGFQASHGPFDENGNYVEKWADSPPKRRYVTTKKTKPTPKPAPQLARIEPAPKLASTSRPTSTKVYSKPKPKPTVAKSKPKPASVKIKPKRKPPITHIVKRGETLYRLSRKYSTSVSSIQKSNRISGTTIRVGQRLSIPR